MADEILLTDENIPPMQDELFRLYSQGFLTDITLSCEDGKNFEAHRVLLAARSQYFYGIVPKLKVEPVIFLKGVKGSHLEKILKYIYSGSATVSRSQLKPILEVAKSLQIRGLAELAPTELSRGTNTSVSGPSKYSGSKTSSPIPTKSKEDSFHRSSPSSQNAREIALQQQQKLYDKLSANLSTKRSPIKNSSPLSERSPQTYKSSSKRGRPTVKNLSSRPVKSEENGEETFKFQYQYISDDSDEIDKDDSNDSDFELAAKRNQNQLAAKLSSSSKRKRGRPPKSNDNSSPIRNKKNYEKDDSDNGFDNIGKHSKSSSDDDSDNSSDDDLDNDQDDNESSDSESDAESASQSDEDDNESPTRLSKSSSPHRNNKTTSPRRSGKETKVKKEGGGPSMDDYYDAPTPARRGGRGPTINGKQMLPVQCKGKRAELHLSKFGNGTNGKSIKYKGEWMTPEEYEQVKITIKIK